MGDPSQKPGEEGWGKAVSLWLSVDLCEELTAFGVKTPWDVRPPPLPPGDTSLAFL